MREGCVGAGEGVGGGVGWASLQKESEAHNDERGDLMTDTPPHPPDSECLAPKMCSDFQKE